MHDDLSRRTVPAEKDASSESPEAGDYERSAAALHLAPLRPLPVYLEWRQVGTIFRLDGDVVCLLRR